MTSSDALKTAAGAAARGAVDQHGARIRDRVEPPVDEFKAQVAEQIESLAGQVRTLGGQFDRVAEAHVVARRLERTADYLRFRPAGDLAADSWRVLTHPRTLWIAGTLFGAVVAYRLFRSNRSDE
jgi:hypothetical protein